MTFAACLALAVVVAATGYVCGYRDGLYRRSKRERRRRSWLAAKILELRAEVEVRTWWCADLLEERDALLKERAPHHPEMN